MIKTFSQIFLAMVLVVFAYKYYIGNKSFQKFLESVLKMFKYQRSKDLNYIYQMHCKCMVSESFLDLSSCKISYDYL